MSGAARYHGSSADSQLGPGACYQSVCSSVATGDKTLLPVLVLSFQRGGI